MASNGSDRPRVLRAFCAENRLRLLTRLQAGNPCACKLIEEVGMKPPALSYPMKILVESGIVESSVVGKWTHYHIREAGREYALILLQRIAEPRKNKKFVPMRK